MAVAIVDVAAHELAILAFLVLAVSGEHWTTC